MPRVVLLLGTCRQKWILLIENISASLKIEYNFFGINGKKCFTPALSLKLKKNQLTVRIFVQKIFLIRPTLIFES